MYRTEYALWDNSLYFKVDYPGVGPTFTLPLGGGRLEQFRQMRVVPFDVPGHKRGRGNPELTAFLGQQCVGVDVNSMNRWIISATRYRSSGRPRSLAADAFGASPCLF